MLENPNQCHPSEVDQFGHGSYLSAKAWNSRVLLEWLNDCSRKAACNELPGVGESCLWYNFRWVLPCVVMIPIHSCFLMGWSEDRTLGRWLQQEIASGRQTLPNDPLLVMNPMASPLVGNCLVVVVVIFQSLPSVWIWGKLYVSGLAFVNNMVASWFFAEFSLLCSDKTILHFRPGVSDGISLITSWLSPQEPISSRCHLWCWEPISEISHSVLQNFFEAWFVLELRVCTFGNFIILVSCFPNAGWASCAGYLSRKCTYSNTRCIEQKTWDPCLATSRFSNHAATWRRDLHWSWTIMNLSS